MSTPLPDIPDSQKLGDGNDRMNETRARVNQHETEITALEADVYSATPNAVAGKLLRYVAGAGGVGTIAVATPQNDGQAASKGYVDSVAGGGGGWNGGTVTGQIYLVNAFAVASGYVSAWINGDGRIGKSASSRRYKKDIHTADLADIAAGLRVVVFHYDPAAFPDEEDVSDDWNVGLIAEEVAEIAPWLVYFDAEGRPDSVRYELLALALIPTLRALGDRVTDLERKIHDLGG